MLFHSVLNNNMVAFVESPATDTYYYKYFILRCNNNISIACAIRF